MKSVLNMCCEKKERPFPKLMKLKASGAIILATGKNGPNWVMGTIVSGESDSIHHSGTTKRIGDYHTAFIGAEDYDGTVTLSND